MSQYTRHPQQTAETQAKRVADQPEPLVFAALIEDVVSALRPAIYKAIQEACERVPGGERRGKLRAFVRRGRSVALLAGESLRETLMQQLRAQFPQAFPPAQPAPAQDVRYLVLVESGESNQSAYFPDIPGCVATGATLEELQANIGAALRLHLQGMMEEQEPVPLPTTQAFWLSLCPSSFQPLEQGQESSSHKEE
jgi:predicted RNase H-like HicB family nuclease